jgi:hypothetical protein
MHQWKKKKKSVFFFIFETEEMELDISELSMIEDFADKNEKLLRVRVDPWGQLV